MSAFRVDFFNRGHFNLRPPLVTSNKSPTNCEEVLFVSKQLYLFDCSMFSKCITVSEWPSCKHHGFNSIIINAGKALFSRQPQTICHVYKYKERFITEEVKCIVPLCLNYRSMYCRLEGAFANNHCIQDLQFTAFISTRLSLYVCICEVRAIKIAVLLYKRKDTLLLLSP